MSTVLALYPGPSSFRLEQAEALRPLLRARGLRLALANDYVSATDRAVFDDVIELPSAEHVIESWSILDRYRRTHAIAAVLAQSEAGVLAGALLAHALGLPGIALRAALLCTNKHACRRELERAEVAVPRFVLARDAGGVRAFAGRSDIGYPVVLKGVASALGRLVTLVADADGVDAAVARVTRGLEGSPDIRRLLEFAAVAGSSLDCDPRREFLVEAFERGDPVETDGLVVGATPRSFGVSQQVLSKPPRFYIEGYLSPADRTAGELAAIERTSDRALAALGVADSGYSVEMRIERERVAVIEVNGRLGWDEGFAEMFALAIGRQPLVAACELALGTRPAIERRSGVAAALAYASCYEDRIVLQVPPAARVRAIAASDVDVSVTVETGARMYAPPHPDVAPHLAFALASGARTSTAAYARARTAVDELVFELGPVDA